MSDEHKSNYYKSPKNESGRKFRSQMFAIVCLGISSLAVVILITLLATILVKGKKTLINDTSVAVEQAADADSEDAAKKGLVNWGFLSGVHKENNPEESGIGQAIIGSALICFLCALVAIPVGVGTAIFLEEFQPRNKYLRWIHGLVQLNAQH